MAGKRSERMRSGRLPSRCVQAAADCTARVDGARFMRLYWNVALPVLGPMLAFLGIFTFVTMWNDYLWPPVVLTDPNKLTVPTLGGLQQRRLQHGDGGNFGGHRADDRRVRLRRSLLHLRPHRGSGQGLSPPGRKCCAPGTGPLRVARELTDQGVASSV